APEPPPRLPRRERLPASVGARRARGRRDGALRDAGTRRGADLGAEIVRRAARRPARRDPPPRPGGRVRGPRRGARAVPQGGPRRPLGARVVIFASAFVSLRVPSW